MDPTMYAQMTALSSARTSPLCARELSCRSMMRCSSSEIGMPISVRRRLKPRLSALRRVHQGDVPRVVTQRLHLDLGLQLRRDGLVDAGAGGRVLRRHLLHQRLVVYEPVVRHGHELHDHVRLGATVL